MLLATNLAPFLSILKGLKIHSKKSSNLSIPSSLRVTTICYRILSSWGKSCIICTVIKAKMKHQSESVQFSSVQSLSRVRLFMNLGTAAHQASLSINNYQSLPKLMSIELLMPSNHLILCHPLLLPSSIFPRIRDFSNESAHPIRWPKYWSFSISPSSEYSELISLKIDWYYLLALLTLFIGHQTTKYLVIFLLLILVPRIIILSLIHF